jgi:hypothetical protein
MTFYEANSGKHIDEIVSNTNCATHDAPQGFPCFSINYDNGKGDLGPAVCGPRIIKAGFNGTISPNSLRQGGKSRSGR